ncbi:MAG: hypothetical protein ACK5GN_04155 [Pseudomonadota bacterium]
MRLEPVSKISSAPVDEMRAATSSNFAKKSSVYLRGYTCGFFPCFPRLASHLVNLATKLFLRPVLVALALTGIPASSYGQDSAELQAPWEDIGSGISISESRVAFPPLSRAAIDALFDSLRSGGSFAIPGIKQSQQVPNNIAGIWAGVRSGVESTVGVITLRFRPSDEARLSQVDSSRSTPMYAESFDVELELKDAEFLIRHQLAANKLARLGLRVDLGLLKANRVLTEFVKGYRDAGMYFAWPPLVRQTAHNAWALLICPRTPQFVQRRRNEDARLELQRSPYQLHEVHFSISASAQARIPPTDKPERVAVRLLPSGNLPAAEQNNDEVLSLSPQVEVPYRAAKPFGSMKLPLVEGSLQEGILVRTVTENPAGYVRRQYFSHVVYVHRLNEPSPVPVIIGEHRAARDEGDCYIVAVQRSTWNEYDRSIQTAAP